MERGDLASIGRRDFLTKTGAMSLALPLASKTLFSAPKAPMVQRPNIIIFITDQLAQKGMGAYGNRDVQTPNLDKIALSGVRFSHAYTAVPLCQPTRCAFWTSRYPFETGVFSNEYMETLRPGIPTMGETFQSAGYDTQHFGKTHDAGALRGFTVNSIERDMSAPRFGPWMVNGDTQRDCDTRQKVIDYLRQQHTRPFLLVVDLYNPHNICGFVGANQGPHTDNALPAGTTLPPLPDNWELTDLETRPLPVRYLCCTHPRLRQACEWSRTNYRHYLAAYYHYANRVDMEIGAVLDAVKKSDAAQNTLLVHFADHGDGMAAHRMVTKQTSFYEECVRVPFSFSGPGIQNSGTPAERPLVSLLDLFPTLCAYAGIQAPENVRGMSLLPWLKGGNPATDREYVVSHWYEEYYKYSAYTPGRMLRTKRYKYMKYLEGNGEEFYDLENDPGETRNLINEAGHASALQQHRTMLENHIKNSGDHFNSLQPKVLSSNRETHPPGYQNHFHPYIGIRDTHPGQTRPAGYALTPYANPATAAVNIHFSIPKNESVTISICTRHGKNITTLLNGPRRPGAHRVEWNGRDRSGMQVASGNYIVRLKSTSAEMSRMFSYIT